jgi:branched-chain amino acid transport system ATP-binding protein
MTVLDNVMVGAFSRTKNFEMARDISNRVLHKVGLQGKLGFLAAYLTLPDLKLLEVAKALATQPKYLLLDEVMAGLNLKEQHIVASMLEGIHADGIGILLVEHSLAIVARMSDRVICLDSGKIIAEGSASEVLASKVVQAAYMGIDHG